MKEIYFGYHDYPVTISDAGYEKVLQIVEEYKLCSVCGLHYNEDNPMALRNMCLRCVLQKHAGKNLHFVGVAGGYYRFRSETGYIFTAYPSGRELEEEVDETIRYYGFPMPKSYKDGERDVLFSTSSWSVHGDFQTSPVVVIEYTERFGSGQSLQYLSYRGAGYIPLTKRSGWMRELFTRGKTEAERTHKESNYAYWIYDMISDLASGK